MKGTVAAFLALGLLLFGGCSRESGPASAPADVASLQQAFVKAVERAVPAVVNIRTVTALPRGSGSSRQRTDRQRIQDYLTDMTDENGGLENSLGSGVIVADDGLIVTNEHVIRDADEIIVRLWNRAEYPARVVGADARTDVALLRIQPSGKLPVAVLGDSGRLKVGEWAIAVGNPFGLESTVTLGVISATGRTDLGVESTEDFIQTDASINPGNSGGPLLNTRGEVVGINTAMVSAGQGIGFAIPINTVMAVEQELARSGSIRRGWLGVGIQALTPELAESFGAKGEKGILVNGVAPQSPAEKGGLRGGDIITSFRGKPVSGLKEFQKQVVSASPGSTVSMEILRGGKRARVEVTIAEMERQAARIPYRKTPVDAWGLAVEEVPPRAVRDLGIEGGVEVAYVDAAGPAWEGGIREG
ncbi:MAG TPA: trypsin-like peptidase domain-containing protein, partial [Candidatus Deferrimicrobiaceae bacterium]|nr:trypsin-like peptidase domain-containing protein [Candidatus Deferrimicrobiaceae bacterium]